MTGVSRTRTVITLGFIVALLWGAFWGEDDHFPFGPFRMYSTTQRLNGQTSWYGFYGITAEGNRRFISGASYGMRRAELEGQVTRIRKHPELLCVIAKTAENHHPSLPKFVAITLVRSARQLQDGRPVGDTQRSVRATCHL